MWGVRITSRPLLALTASTLLTISILTADSLAAAASAGGLHWVGAGHALRLHAAGRCTLVVDAPTIEGERPAWQLVFCGRFDLAAQLLSPLAEVSEIASAVRPAMIDRISHSPRRVLLPFETTRPRRIEFILRIEPGDDARIGLLARSPADSQEWTVVDEVTVGSPGACEYPRQVCISSE